MYNHIMITAICAAAPKVSFRHGQACMERAPGELFVISTPIHILFFLTSAGGIDQEWGAHRRERRGPSEEQARKLAYMGKHDDNKRTQ